MTHVTPPQYVLLRAAYRSMLKVDHNDRARHTREYQSTLAGLRDWIAYESGIDSETTQNLFEDEVKR